MTGKRRFTYELLKNLITNSGVTLLQDYSKTYLTRDSIIKGKCISCENVFSKTFNKLDKNKIFGCNECTTKIKFERIKHTMVEKYGVEYASKSEEFKTKMKKTCLEKFGVEHPTQNIEIKEKTKATNLEKYGVNNKDIKEKRKQTNLERYGVENCNQNPEVIERRKQTNLERYGTECSLKNEIVKQKIRQTNLEKYGTEYGFQNEDVKQKIRQTNLEKYGVEYNLQRKDIKEKVKLNNLEKYGVEYIIQNHEFLEKAIKHMYKSKDYIFPSGKKIKIQGYENHAINELIENNINEEDIITGAINVPEIWYYDAEGKKRRHFVDIYIPSQNRCIEVKSTWTYQLHTNNVILKQEAGKKLGYNYEIWIYNKVGKKLETYM